MKSTVETFKVEGNMGAMGETVEMSIRAEDTVHLMAVLTDLYKNRLLAVIREYSTNAWDAHVAAGVALPIEVTLPTGMHPSLTIRDYGLGLDADDIRDIYSQYGRSTKRGTNDQVGMLGLGCKSALTYTTQFTVSSVKDGKRVTVLVSREEDGAGTMRILGQPTETDEANGTTVTVSIRREDHYRADELAREFFAYWPTDSVLLNGRPPEHFTARGDVLKLSDTLYLSGTLEESRVVMGNVAYKHEIPLGIEADSKLIAFVPIGAVRPTPSRESLMDVAATGKAVDAIVTEYHDTIEGAIQAEVTNAATAPEAIAAIVKWEKYLPKNASDKAYTWQGNPLPADFSLPPGPELDHRGQPQENFIEAAPFTDRNRKSWTQRFKHVSVKQWNKMIWVEGFTPNEFTAVHKNKLTKWARDMGYTASRSSMYYRNTVEPPNAVSDYLLLRGKAPDSVFLDKARIVSWETIKAIKLEPQGRSYNGTVRIPGSYDVFTENGYKSGLPGSEFRQDKPILWARGNRWANENRFECIKVLYPEFTLVCLAENRVNKFNRDVPKAVEVGVAIKTGFDKWVKTVDQKDLIALAMRDDHEKANYSALDPALVNDPKLAEYIEIAKRNVDSLDRQRRMFRIVISSSELNVKYDDLLNQTYPLYQRHLAAHPHTYAYINMVYAAAQAAQP